MCNSFLDQIRINLNEDLANSSTILSSEMLKLVELFADMRSRLCRRPLDIVVRRWFLTRRSREKALSAEADVTGRVRATSTM